MEDVLTQCEFSKKISKSDQMKQQKDQHLH